ncbi:hypothetical protein RRG08_024682 [Elysia crispata]|uniref:Sushi domain-containing protein n=1 Tax=Elysia crispata TaxID=231223 RepID=A0AAE0YEH1_9GAST|nr:hypothetical protein RRG08_024682 [Elysia crispata]
MTQYLSRSNISVVARPMCEPDAEQISSSQVFKNYFFVTYYDNFTMRYSCLTNYHLASGNLVRDCLPNGTWSGMAPKCEVDYYMEKSRLSLIIITVSLLVPCVLLFLDFMNFVRKRRVRRNIFVRVASQTSRMVEEHSVMSRVALQEYEAYFDGDIELSSAEALGNIKQRGRYKTADTYSMALGQIPVRRSLALTRSSPREESRSFLMFGAGRHLAQMGKKLWDI